METQVVPIISAFWFGVLTSISPCPLASNIAAVSYMVKGVEKSSSVLTTGLMYTLGRMIAYIVLGILISASLLNIPQASQFMQNIMPKILGPVLILTGFFLLGLISFSLPGFSVSEKTALKFGKNGNLGALLLGVLFALSFCPVSAALFFGSLIPLTVQNNSPIILPSLYGIGTGLPVLAFALAIASGTKNISKIFNAVTKTEYWSRKITAGILIAVGIYYILTKIFYLNLF
jgi:cytochrome c-type biogenesis protein